MTFTPVQNVLTQGNAVENLVKWKIYLTPV